MSKKEILDSFSHIELTEDEEMDAIIWAKQRKDAKLKDQALRQKEEENRRKLTQTQWDLSQTDSFMRYRANSIFGTPFIVDKSNEFLFELLCRYFSKDIGFLSLAESCNVKNPSLDKGIFLCGNFGVGKTWMMKLFSRNQRQVFQVINAKVLADFFETSGQSGIDSGEYVNKIKNPVNDASCFFHQYSGLCIDDIGTEDVKTHYGNKKNVIGDLIEKRYAAGNCGIFFHATTNFTSQQLLDFYGGRVTSRMREVLNVIEVKGKDRRS